jgi:hypothetical protein
LFGRGARRRYRDQEHKRDRCDDTADEVENCPERRRKLSHRHGCSGARTTALVLLTREGALKLSLVC